MVSLATDKRRDIGHEALTYIEHVILDLPKQIGYEAALARIKRVATEACDDIEAVLPD
jgi:hypothetical protein